MTRSRVGATVAIALVVTPLALLAAACSRPPEQQQLTQFFRAARARDNTTVSMMSAVPFDLRTQGSVESFEITNVSAEQRTPIDFKTPIEAENAAKAAQAEFTKNKIAYQNANLAIIEEVVKLERTPDAKMNPAQTKVKAEWDKWRADTAVHTKAVADARRGVENAAGPADHSLSQPGQPAFDAAKFQGEVVSKDVTLNAQVKSPDGQTAQKTLVVTFQRVTGTLDGQPREGRWIITKIAGA
jgi:hypothetical protein